MKTGWAKQWKRDHMVPWECQVCSTVNRYLKPNCKSCGKEPPRGANLILEDAAAQKIQGLFRARNERGIIRTLCAQVFRKEFDPDTRQTYYINLCDGTSQWEKPKIFGEDFDLEMDEESRKQKETALKKTEEENERGIAKKQRDEEREQKHKEQIEEEENARKRQIESKWDAPFKFSERNGEFIANWKDFTEIPDRFMKLAHNFTVVRLIGNPFVNLPENFCTSLSRVTVLGLSNCSLQKLPENFGCMQTLTDLNLLKNDLESLPESFGMLTELRQLHLSSNKLTGLPKSFANLINIPRLNIERNNMRSLPENIMNLRIRILSLSKMGLVKLPRKLGELSTLVSITADQNGIKNIPRSIGLLTSLQHLSLCNNSITIIPDEICKCKSLQRLWLDWNMISELPGDFLMLEQLENIHLEGNPMRVPEQEIVVKGIKAIRSWYVETTDFMRNRERKWILQEIQGLLFQCKKRKLVSPGYLQHPCTSKLVGEISDKYFAFPHKALFNQIIPKWNDFVDNDYLRYQVEDRRSELESKGGESILSSQKSFTNSPISLKKKAASVYSDSPKSRRASVTSKSVTSSSVAGSSKDGNASSLATPLPSFSRFLYTEEEVIDAMQNYKDAYGITCSIDSEKALFKECKCTDMNGEPRVCIPPNADFRCERTATLFKAKLVSEEVKVNRESLKAEERSVVEERKRAREESRQYAESEEGDKYFTARAEQEADKEMEADRIRNFEQKEKGRKMKSKRKKDNKIQKRRDKLEKKKQERIEKLQAKKKEIAALKERSKGWEYDKCVEQLVDIEDELSNLPEDEELEHLDITQEDADDLFQQEMKTATRLYKKRGDLRVDWDKKMSKEYKNYVVEFKSTLIEAHAVAAEEKAEKAVRREFRITRRIMKNWMNLNLTMTFRQWKDYVMNKMYWRARIAREEEMTREIKEQAQLADVYYKTAEELKWIKKVDIFSDQEYWEHKETKKISFTEPKVENFIPHVKIKKK